MRNQFRFPVLDNKHSRITVEGPIPYALTSPTNPTAPGGAVLTWTMIGGGGEDWATTLGIGNTSGGTDAELSSGGTQETADALVGTAVAAPPSAVGGPVHMHGGGGAAPYGYRGPVLSGTDPIGGGYGYTVAGSTRGGQAVDLQQSRSLAAQIAEGQQSFLFPGLNNQVQHVRTAIGGQGNAFTTPAGYLFTTYGRDNFVWGELNTAATTYGYWRSNLIIGQYNAFDATEGYSSLFLTNSFSTTGTFDYPLFRNCVVHGISPDFYGFMEGVGSFLSNSGSYMGGFLGYSMLIGVGAGTSIGTGYRTSGTSVQTSVMLATGISSVAQDGDVASTLAVGEDMRIGASIGSVAGLDIEGAVVTGQGMHSTKCNEEVHGTQIGGAGIRTQATRTPLVARTLGAIQTRVMRTNFLLGVGTHAVENTIRFNVAHAVHIVVVARQQNADALGGAIGDHAMWEIRALVDNSGVSPGTVSVTGSSGTGLPLFDNAGVTIAGCTVTLAATADVLEVTVASNYGGGATEPDILWMAYAIGPHVGDDSS